MTMQSRPSSQLLPGYTLALMAVMLNAVIRLRRQRPAGSNTLPCQRKQRAKPASNRPHIDPEHAIAVPVASPVGIGPGGLVRNISSSSVDGFFRSSAAVKGMVIRPKNLTVAI